MLYPKILYDKHNVIPQNAIRVTRRPISPSLTAEIGRPSRATLGTLGLMARNRFVGLGKGDKTAPAAFRPSSTAVCIHRKVYFIPFRCSGWEQRFGGPNSVIPVGEKGYAGSWSVVGPGNKVCAVLFPRNGGEEKASAHVFTGIAPSQKPSADVFTGIAVSKKAFGGVFTGIATSKKASTEVFTGIAHSKKAFDDVFTGIKTS